MEVEILKPNLSMLLQGKNVYVKNVGFNVKDKNKE